MHHFTLSASPEACRVLSSLLLFFAASATSAATATAQCHQSLLERAGEQDQWGDHVVAFDDELVVAATHGRYLDVLKRHPVDGWTQVQRIDLGSDSPYAMVGGGNWLAIHYQIFGGTRTEFFERTGSGWVLRQSLPSSPMRWPSMSSDGSTFAMMRDDDAISIFERSSGTWQLAHEQLLPLSDPRFTSVDVDGDWIAVGGFEYLGGTNFNQVLRRTDAGWAPFPVPPPAHGDWTTHVAVDDEWMAVHGTRISGSVPFVELFRWDGSNWQRDQVLTSPAVFGSPSGFGHFLEFRDDRLIIGHKTALVDGWAQGAVVVHELDGGSWDEVHRWFPIAWPENGDSIDRLAVDPTGEWITVSNRGTTAGPGGAARLFVSRWTPHPHERFCPGGVNSTGLQGRIDAPAVLSLGQPTFSFVADQLPPLELGLLVCGRTRDARPIGNGTLCIDGESADLVRLGFSHADSNGVLTHVVDAIDAPWVQVAVPGDGWIVQMVHRDGVAGLGLTDALKVWFCP